MKIRLRGRLRLVFDTDGTMILEAAYLNVRPGGDTAFVEAMKQGRPLIAAAPGSPVLSCVPAWNDPAATICPYGGEAEDHTEGFRGSDRYLKWKALLHRFYEPFPVLEHFAEPIA